MCFMILLALGDLKHLLVDQLPHFLDDEPSNAAAIPNGLTTSSVIAYQPSKVQIAQCCSDLIVRILSGS